LKSLGLLALAELQAADKTLVAPCRDAILKCLDEEVSVRSRALSLIAKMASRTSLIELVAKLIEQLEANESTYRDEVIAVILAAVRSEGFAHVPSFRWLVTVLFSLATMPSSHGTDIAQLIVEVTLRVPAVRSFAAERSLEMAQQLSSADFPEPTLADAAPLAAALVLGEHAQHLPLHSQHAALDSLLAPAVSGLSADAQATCVQSALRILVELPTSSLVLTDDEPTATDSSPKQSHQPLASLSELTPIITRYLPSFARLCASPHTEVIERATLAYQLLHLLTAEDGSGLALDEGGGSGAAVEEKTRAGWLRSLRSGLATELRAVAPKAQKRVKRPPGLDLDTPLYTPPPPPAPAPTASPRQQTSESEPASESPARAPRAQPSGPYYLPSEPTPGIGGPLASGAPSQPSAHGPLRADDGEQHAKPTLPSAALHSSALSQGAPSSEVEESRSAKASLHGSIHDMTKYADAHYGDEGGGVLMEEAMPDGADESDEEATTTSPSDHQRSQCTPLLGGALEPSLSTYSAMPSSAMLVDLLTPGVDGAPSRCGEHPAAAEQAVGGGEAAGHGRRRRRKHRSAAGAAVPGEGEAEAPLMAL